MEEIWKDIKGYEGLYQVSDHGNVRSVPRLYQSKEQGFNWDRYTAGNNLVLHKHRDGYPQVGLYKDGKLKTRQVHRLVAEAFCPKVKGNNVVNHLDNDKTNNFLQKLRMDNPQW